MDSDENPCDRLDIGDENCVLCKDLGKVTGCRLIVLNAL